ncbi:MAG: hypothetical protein Q8940_19055 [Bacteroidota bacterium]|nr:hypothetical protein [Bacteroidota bacterium]
MKMLYILVFTIILLLTVNHEEVSAQSWTRYAKENCKYKCYLQKREYLLNEDSIKTTITDTLLLNAGIFKILDSSEVDKFSSVTLNVYDTLSQKIGIKNKSIELYLAAFAYKTYGTKKQNVTHQLSSRVLIKVNNEYALTTDITSKDYTVFNLLNKSLGKIELDTREKVLQYVDFMVRFYYMPELAFYRINKPEDIWNYPQYRKVVYVYPWNNYITEVFKRFNKKMMVEHAPLEGEYDYTDMKNFKTYGKYIDKLMVLIKPAEVYFTDDEISVATFMAPFQLIEDVELWKIRLKKDGTLIELNRQPVLGNAGDNFIDWFSGEKSKPDLIFPPID